MPKDVFTTETQCNTLPASGQAWRCCAAILMLLFGFGAIAIAQDKTAPTLIVTETTPEKNLKVFDALWEKVNRDYFDPNFNGANWAKLKETYRPQAAQAATRQALLAVLQQMVRELKTSHVSVGVAVKRRNVEQALEQKIDRKRDSLYLTTGLSWRKLGEQFVVTEIAEHSSAQRAGVQVGWVVTHYNNEPLPLPEAPEVYPEVYEAANVPCRFLDEGNQERRLTLQYGWVVEKPQFKSELLAHNIGYLKFDGFNRDTDKLLEEAVARFQATTALILDLRGNGGGYEYQVRNCLNLFLREATEYGTFIQRSGKTKEANLKGRGAKAYAGKLIVLTDEHSASGAEIFAAVIQESKRGRLVGRTTSGAVLVSYALKLPEDFRMSLAVRDYLTPNGRRLEGKGVAPDVSVPFTMDDVRRKRDPDLAQALELLR